MNTLEQAFHHIPRSNFLPRAVRKNADEDYPLPIGYGQTNSQPSTVRAMLRWLHVNEGDKVLDVGSGSGWTTALLAYLTGPKGHIDATERIPELLAFGQKNCDRLGIANVSFHRATALLGWPAAAPYDRILVSASANNLPLDLVAQLKMGGTMVIPVQNEILEITRTPDTTVSVITHPGFIFVPLLP